MTLAGLRRDFIGYGFILPWIIALVVFIGFPFLAGLYFSFCEFPPLKAPQFIGLENYQELAADARLRISMSVTLIYAAVAIPIGVVLAMTLAMFLNARIRGQALYRVIFYIPHLVPTVVVAILWMWIFNPKYGLLNIVLAAILRVVDGWTQCFLHPAAALSTWGPGPSAAVLGAAFLGVLLASGLALRIGGRPGLKRYLTGLGILAAILIAVPLLVTAFDTWMPVDMKKIRSPGWLTDSNPFPSFVSFAPSWALWALIVMGLWGVGQMAVIYLAKLQDVPVELYEAADIDGATWLGKTWQITLPMISPVILFNVVMAIIGTFQVFAEPYIMTQGGPEDKTRFVAMFVYDNAFQYQRVGYASAVAWVLFLLIVALTLLAFRLSRRHVYYAGR